MGSIGNLMNLACIELETLGNLDALGNIRNIGHIGNIGNIGNIRSDKASCESCLRLGFETSLKTESMLILLSLKTEYMLTRQKRPLVWYCYLLFFVEFVRGFRAQGMSLAFVWCYSGDILLASWLLIVGFPARASNILLVILR